MVPRNWLKARERWLADVGRLDDFNRRLMHLMTEGVGFDERHEILDEEFGATYEVLEPYLSEYAREQKERKASGRKAAAPPPSGPEPEAGSEVRSEIGSEMPDAASVPDGSSVMEIGGDLSDVRWALANLSKTKIREKDAPSAIAYNLLVIARGGVQGQLKLMDIYRSTIIQPAAKAAESSPLEGQDAHLEGLLRRLSEGLVEDPA
jgi:hypothetical protein